MVSGAGKGGWRGARLVAGLLAAAVGILVAILALSAVSSQPAGAAPPGSNAPSCAPSGEGVDFLGFSDALDKDSFVSTEVGGLSDVAYDRQRDLYYSLSDDTPARFYTLKAPIDRSGLRDPNILDVTTLRDASGEAFRGESFDGEGLALTRQDELLVSSETEPSIRRFSLEGELLGELPVPRRFMVAPEGGGQQNGTFESLSLSPNGRSLFTAVERPLASDGQTEEGEGRVRILRYEDRGPGGFEPAEQFFYLAEPEQGVVEISALSESELLVLERGFVPGEGNTIRIFRVSLSGAGDVSDEPTLAGAGLELVDKELVVDLSDCPPSGATTPGTQENPLLDNYEGLALGPRLPGGRRALLLVSDDNFNDVQVTRLVALGARLNNPHLPEGRGDR